MFGLTLISYNMLICNLTFKVKLNTTNFSHFQDVYVLDRYLI